MKIKQQTQEPIKKNNSTKHYDEVSTKIKKLLSATAKTFIPELCDALRKDWYPTLSETAIQSNKTLRDDIREKIFKDWSNERGNETPWGDDKIQQYLSKWLKNPSELLKESATKNISKAWQKTNPERLVSEHTTQKIKEVVDELPNEIIDEEEPKSVISDEEMHDLGIAPYTEAGKSIRQLTGDIVGNALRLFAALVNNDTYPNSRSDILVDYIRPSREFFKGLMLELDRDKRIEIDNYLYFVIRAAEDRREIIHKINDKEDQ